MKTYDLKKIRKSMEKMQDPKRYEHTLGVCYTAAALAMRYEVSLKDAQTAGLLHDCAKCLSDEKMLRICEKHNILISPVEKRNPELLHAKVGSFMAMEEFHVYDSDIINAILNHTTGRPGMSTLEKIIFVADYIEPGRKKASHLEELRKLAFVDLDRALVEILRNILDYLQQQENEIDLMTQKTYEYYLQELQKEEV